MLENETPRGEYEIAGDENEEMTPDSWEAYGDSEAGEYENDEIYEEEEEDGNLADVAERILGARHSRVTTAAPIVTRPEAKSPAGERPKKTSAMTKHIPVRPRNEDLTRTRQLQAAERARRREEEERRRAEAEKKRKRAAVIAVALVAVLLIGAGIGTAAAVAKHRAEANRAKDPALVTPVDNEQTNAPNDANDALPPIHEADPAGTGTTDDSENPENTEDPGTADASGDTQTDTNEQTENPDEEPGSDSQPSDSPSAEQPSTAGPTDVQLNPPSTGGNTTGEEGDNTEWVPPELPKYWIVVDFYDRPDLTVQTVATTLGALLANNGITLEEGERASVDLWNDWLASDQTITVDKYVYTTEDIPETVAHTREEIGVDTVPRGQTRTLQEGVDGQSVKHYTVAYKNGVEFDRRLDWEEVVTAMVPEKVQIGVGGTLVGKDGVTYSYAYHFTCPATYYSTSEYTFSGNYVSSRTVAADFNYFALGTKMYVKNNRYDFGYRVVEERGSNFDPWEIAVWMPADDPNAPLMMAEGYVTDMEIYILD